MLSSCGVAISSNTSTAAPTYIHYTPPKEFNTHLEFDYPSSWTFSQERIKDTDIIVIGMGDPRFLTIPTRPPNESHGTPSDFGGVSILLQPIKTNQTLDTLITSYKQNDSGNSRVTFLNGYKIKIGEHEARVLEYQINDQELYTSLMFDRSTFFVVDDQMYQITFKIAEKDRGAEFEQGYEYFFKSLKIVP
jgi:hypothetical protein